MTTLKKKHYERISNIIKEKIHKAIEEKQDGFIGETSKRNIINYLTDVSIDLADYFKEDNKNFKKDKFLIECGIK